jgi:hypothetical protein
MASRTTKRPLVFSVIRDDTQAGYAHLAIRVHEPAYGGFNRESLLEVTFQSDQESLLNRAFKASTQPCRTVAADLSPLRL